MFRITTTGDAVDRTKLRPAKGDRVQMAGNPAIYGVTAVGMKYIRAYREGEREDVVYTIKMDQVFKVSKTKEDVVAEL